MKIQNKGFLAAALIMITFGVVMLYFQSMSAALAFFMFGVIVAFKKGLSF